MSFLKGLMNIIDVVNKASNDEFEVTREGRRFKILVEGRFHDPTEPWVYDVTATDTITGTSEKVKHFDTKEDGVCTAVDAVMRALRQKGFVGDVTSVAIFDRGQPAATTSHSPAQALSSYNQGRNEHTNRALMKILTKQGLISEPSPPAPVPMSPPPTYHHAIQSAQPSDIARPLVNIGSPPSSQKVPLSQQDQRNRTSDVFQYDIEPDVDGLYTSVTVAPADPDLALFDPRSTYVTWESARKGFIYILNNNEFPHLPPDRRMRRGSEIDVQNVVHVFSQLGYEPLVHQNLTRMEILTSLEETVRRINAEGDRHSSLCLFFMSHGNREGVSGTDVSLYNPCIVSRDEIKGKLSGRRCKALLGKPKLIFIQACRGNAFTRNADELDALKSAAASGQDTEPPFEMDYVPEEKPLESCEEPPFEMDFVPQVDTSPLLAIDLDSLGSHDNIVDLVDTDGGGELPDNSDIFVANATSNGYYSIRMRRDGSWFIQAISEIFLGHAHIDDLNELMRKVTCLVTERYRSQYSDEVTKRQFEVRQTPAYESQGMRRRFFFLPKYPSSGDVA